MQQPILVAQNLCKKYRKRAVVKDISFTIYPSEIIGLLGPNGAGKTTCFNMIAGLIRADSGTVMFNSHQLDDLPLYKRARLGLGYLPQEETIFRGLSARDNLQAIIEAKGLTDDVDDMLQRFNLQHVQHNLGSQLSGGEKRRLEIARLLLTKPKILLLDEPFAGVDPIAVADIRQFIRQVRDSGVAILLNDHNVREALSICDRAYLISAGTIMLEGAPEYILTSEIARKTYLGEDFHL